MADFSLYYITAPLVGGVIGYITNYIAIKMLFRPHTPKYVAGLKVPFTPGIIPKEKHRIADAIGGAISQNLMNEEVLSRYLLSDEMKGKVRNTVAGFLEKQKKNPETVADFLLHYMSEKELKNLVESVNADLTTQVADKLADSDVGQNVAHVVVANVVEKMKKMNPTEVLGGLLLGVGGLRALAAKIAGVSLWNKFFTLLQAPAEKMLTGNINKMLHYHGEEMVAKMLGNEVDSLIHTPVCKLLEGKEEQLEQVVTTIERIYQTVISEHLPRILESIDISKIVRERINEMSMDEVERIILQVMQKELKAIVWLGALLGTIMGCINIFFR